jgi:Acyl-CoA reductase (LuxC)
MKIQQISPTRERIDIEMLSVFKNKNFTLQSFDERVVAFSNRLSKRILTDKTYGRVPALTALAYWLRKANIARIIDENAALKAQKNVYLSPIGVVFHICPANVDTMFIYSLMVSLLMGNKNVLRVSNRLDHEYISFLFEVLNQELATEESEIISNYINIVTYDHEKEINEFFSQNANARLIWGGDNTAKIFKAIPSNPRIRDIVFADRVSVALFETKAFLAADETTKNETVRKFYNDSYTFDQKGCSSPQTIILKGNLLDNQAFENVFYEILNHISTEMYGGDSASLASLKFNQLVGDVIDEKVTHFRNDSATLYLVETNEDNLLHTCGGGYFYTKKIDNINKILPSLNTKVQTISHFGLSTDDIDDLAHISAGIGVDRIVPVGKALDFDYIWDGYNLCEALSVKKHIQYV